MKALLLAMILPLYSYSSQGYRYVPSPPPGNTISTHTPLEYEEYCALKLSCRRIIKFHPQGVEVSGPVVEGYLLRVASKPAVMLLKELQDKGYKCD